MKMECCQNTLKMDRFSLISCRQCGQDFHRTCYDVYSGVHQSVQCLRCRLTNLKGFLRVEEALTDTRKISLSPADTKVKVPFNLPTDLVQQIRIQAQSGFQGPDYQTLAVVITMVRLPKQCQYKAYDQKCYRAHLNKQPIEIPQHTPLVIQGIQGKENRKTGRVDIFSGKNCLDLELLENMMAQPVQLLVQVFRVGCQWDYQKRVDRVVAQVKRQSQQDKYQSRMFKAQLGVCFRQEVVQDYLVDYRCPLTRERVVMPAKTLGCTHQAYFCLLSQLESIENSATRQYQCPICHQSASVHELFLDTQLQDYLTEVQRYDKSIGRALLFQVYPDKNYEIKLYLDDQPTEPSPPKLISKSRLHISQNKALQDSLKKAYQQKITKEQHNQVIQGGVPQSGQSIQQTTLVPVDESFPGGAVVPMSRTLYEPAQQQVVALVGLLRAIHSNINNSMSAQCLQLDLVSVGEFVGIVHDGLKLYHYLNPIQIKKYLRTYRIQSKFKDNSIYRRLPGLLVQYCQGNVQKEVSVVMRLCGVNHDLIDGHNLQHAQNSLLRFLFLAFLICLQRHHYSSSALLSLTYMLRCYYALQPQDVHLLDHLYQSTYFFLFQFKVLHLLLQHQGQHAKALQAQMTSTYALGQLLLYLLASVSSHEGRLMMLTYLGNMVRINRMPALALLEQFLLTHLQVCP